MPNLFVTDGACMTSSACQNPSLTYMALTARACHYAIDQLRNLHLIDRRCFLRAGTTAIGTLVASGLPGRQGRAEPAGRLDRIGLQLYTVRHDFIRNVDETLAAVARVGYSEVELFSPYAPQGWTPGKLRSALDQAGLSAPSTHVGGNLLQNGWEKHLEAALVLGCRYIVCGSPERDALHTMRDWHELADLLNRAGEAARKAGLQLGYHNHDFEFVPVEGQIPYNVLLAKTDPALMQLELDLYWITKAGGDPLAYFKRWPGRFFAVHIKDMDATPSGKCPTWVPVSLILRGSSPSREMRASNTILLNMISLLLQRWKAFVAASPTSRSCGSNVQG